ncbi:DUF4148 domain-containing protein [Burkholderia multivorans]|uniref:DUF4148 domain-containing protein n=1 Tax=Burkholderia multivorans TaxID=87883 RepID=UPI001C21A715|nr:DUF4148 domain-containing protein [Burkholderia multivorans]MBU9650218.1 DUF4148 domain-containing protein [Burkholderia multivorans]
MKTSIIALTFATFTASGAALATESAAPLTVAQTEQSGPNQVGVAPKPKTRADVRDELVRAQQDGQLASLRRLYRGS